MVGALWDCVPRVCGGGVGCASGGVPLGAVPAALSWSGEVSLGAKHQERQQCVSYGDGHVEACYGRMRLLGAAVGALIPV